MESDRICTIEDWPTTKSVRDVLVLLGFNNFSGRFIRKYAKVTLPLTELVKQSETSCDMKSEGSAEWEWTWEAKLAFRKQKGPSLSHRSSSIVMWPIQSFSKSRWVDSWLRAFLISTMFSGFSGQSISTPGSALQRNRIVTFLIESYWRLWKY